jgi:hypothetical protein
MKKYLLLAAGLALAVLAVVGFTSCTQGSTVVEGIRFSNQQEGIWVSGEGKVPVTPDLAILSLGIEAQAASVADAQTQAAEAMDKVMDALKDNGLADKDIQTQHFSISPVTRWDDEEQKEVVLGYRVSNIVTAKIRDMDKVGETIDAVAAAGGDLTRINGISFTVDDPSAYYDEAREKAVADAKAKAEQLAKLAGVTLGKPTYISEFSEYVPPVPAPIYYKGGAEAALSTPISPGEVEVSLSVQLVYSILK